jgi:hypothetical protein
MRELHVPLLALERRAAARGRSHGRYRTDQVPLRGVEAPQRSDGARGRLRIRRDRSISGEPVRASSAVHRSLYHSAVIRKLVALATILTVASGCDKAKEFVRAGQAAGPPQLAPGEELDLSKKPALLFEVFGESSDPRMVPIGAMVGGELKPIRLTSAGWRRFDQLYQRAGASYALYQNGVPTGSVDVKRGMWSDTADALYALPGCATLTPMASVRVNGRLASDFTLEFLASNAPLGKPRIGAMLSQDSVNRIARAVSRDVAKSVGIKPEKLDSLDFRAMAFYTGDGPAPTIIASYIDATASHPTSVATRTTHLVVIADRDSTGAYHPTFSHRINGPLAAAAFRRYFDHLDIDGDGVDEIVLQGWQFGGDTFLSVLGWREHKWQEIYRTRANWCLDERKSE